jgi:MFS family permease
MQDSSARTRWWGWLSVPANDLWRDARYRRLWLAILLSSLSSQMAGIALALVAAVVLQATPIQIGLLSAIGLFPYIVFSLPAGVWLDRVRKLPVLVLGEVFMALVLAAIPMAWALGQLHMGLMYGVAFAVGCVGVTSGTAAQIVLTQVVPRERLVDGHAKNALASSVAELSGPGVAGLLIKLAGAPLALLGNSAVLLASVALLRGLHTVEAPPPLERRHFLQDMKDGIGFVFHNHMLLTLALMVAAWQVCQTTAMVVQVLFATRVLGLTEAEYGACFTGVGLGTVLASTLGPRLSRRWGPGPCMVLGFALSAVGWLQLAMAPANAWGVAAFVLMLLLFSASTVLIFSNMLAMRQAITPAPMLARMTSIMRWMTLFPAGPGALFGGYVGEHWGLRWALGLGGMAALVLAGMAWRFTALRSMTVLPEIGHPRV